jgi:hypothetical protein
VRSTRASLARSDEVLVVTEKAEVVRQDSDDSNRLLVRDEFLADYTGITIESGASRDAPATEAASRVRPHPESAKRLFAQVGIATHIHTSPEALHAGEEHILEIRSWLLPQGTFLIEK